MCEAQQHASDSLVVRLGPDPLNTVSFAFPSQDRAVLEASLAELSAELQEAWGGPKRVRRRQLFGWSKDTTRFERGAMRK